MRPIAFMNYCINYFIAVKHFGIKRLFYRIVRIIRDRSERISFHRNRELKSYGMRLFPPREYSSDTRPTILNRSVGIVELVEAATGGTKYFFEPDDLNKITRFVKQHFPTQLDQLLIEVDHACKHEFSIHNSGWVQIGYPVPKWRSDRFPRDGWVGFLNELRFLPELAQAYWLTEDESYVNSCCRLFFHWMESASLADRAQWDGIHVSLRIQSLIEMLYLLAKPGIIDQDTTQALIRCICFHADYLNNHLSMDLYNNHLIFESCALITAGHLFSPMVGMLRHKRRGINLLESILQVLVLQDGGLAEQSLSYQCEMLWQLMRVFFLLRAGETHSFLLEAISRMYRFLSGITYPDLSVPLIGDSYKTDARNPRVSDVLALGDAIINSQSSDYHTWRSVWIHPPKKETADTHIRLNNLSPVLAFEKSGYYVLRDSQSDSARKGVVVFDCGPLGYPPLPGHGHADALSITGFAFGNEMIRDTGFYTYDPSLLRLYFRGTSAHNTVCVDGINQSEIFSAFRAGRRAIATCLGYGRIRDISFVAGEHNGYVRLRGAIRHLRIVFSADERYWLLFDYLFGQGFHRYDKNFHVGENATIEKKQDYSLGVSWPDDTGLLIKPCDKTLAKLIISHGETDPLQGWISYEYGKISPSTTITYRKEASAPVSFLTLLVPYSKTQLSEASHRNRARITLIDSFSSGNFEFEVICENRLDRFSVSILREKGTNITQKASSGIKVDVRSDKLGCST